MRQTRFAAVALLAALAASSADAMEIKRVISPGGIEAWLVESHANPLIAMRFAFRGGASQDDPGPQHSEPGTAAYHRAAAAHRL